MVLETAGHMPFPNRFLAAPLALAGACALLVAGSCSVLQAQTIVYRRAVKMPLHLLLQPYSKLNDSGFGATDLDSQTAVTLKSRWIITSNRLYPLQENGDGTAAFGTVRQSDIQGYSNNYGERHINTNPNLPTNPEVDLGIMGLGLRYNEVNYNGQTLDRWSTGMPTLISMMAEGPGITIAMTAGNFTLNGATVRMVNIDRIAHTISPFAGDASLETGKAMGGKVSQALDADRLMYLLDFDNRRILTVDNGATGGTRGAFIGAFDLDPTKTAINSMTVDQAGNVCVGDGKGGFDLYGKNGQWKRGFHTTFIPDPNANGFSNGVNMPANCYMNYYASGLNDGNGTLDVYDDTGYRQYTILAATGVPVGYAAWQAQYFSAAQQADPTVSDPAAAPLGDGVSNLLKYVFNINPAQPMTSAESAAMPAAAITTSDGTQYLSLTYRQYASLTGVSVNAQTSPDLVTWTTVANPAVLSNGIDPVTGDPVMQVGVPVDGSSQFIRLGVAQAQPRLRAHEMRGMTDSHKMPAPLPAR